tara:strand:+ start:593 stop:1168 length:576 start_codon:yes stop_codon:yes gene_type:complete
MIKSAAKIHENVRPPVPPELRRSSRDPKREAAYQQHENIKKYYKTRKADISSVYKIYKNIKYLKYRAKIISKLMIEKYGDSFGSVFTKKITEEYLTIPQSYKSGCYDIEYYNKCVSYVDSGSVPIPVQSPNPFRWHTNGRKEIMYLKSLKIPPDPRVIKYSSKELVSYLQKEYEIMSEGQEYILLSSNPVK